VRVCFAIAVLTVGCAPPASGGPEAPCTAHGVTIDDGWELLHYDQQLDDEGRVVHQERWVHGASLQAITDYLYNPRGELVHQRDDTYGDGRVEEVIDWVRDAEGRVLHTVALDRVSRRTQTIDQQFEGDQVVQRVERLDGELVREETMGLDGDGRVVSYLEVGLDGLQLSHWEATYLQPAPALDRERVGWIGDGLILEATERFDAEENLVFQEGLIDGYYQTYEAVYEDGRLLEEVNAFGELVATHTRTYDEGGRLVEDIEELTSSGDHVDRVVTSWTYSCPPP